MLSRKMKMAVAAAQAAEDGKRFESVDKQDFDTPHDEIRYLLADLKKQLSHVMTRQSKMEESIFRIEHAKVSEEDLQEAAKEAGLDFEQVEEAKSSFELFDTSGNGFIARGDMHKAMASMGRPMKVEDLDGLIDKFDTHGRGVIELDDFLGIYSEIIMDDSEAKPQMILLRMSEYGQDALVRWNEYDDAEIDGAITGDAVAPLRRVARNFLLNKTSELFIYGVIIFAGVASSLEPLVATQGWQNSVVFYVVEYVILAIFAMECMVKMCAESAGKWYAYFQDSWNTFDFSITLILMVMTPFGNAEVSVGRLLRLLRAVRLVRGAKMFPKLIIVLDAVFMSSQAAIWIIMCLALVMYIYAVIGVSLFMDNDPFHFGDLPSALLSLFRISTLEDWTDIMYFNVYGCNEWGHYKSAVSRGTAKCQENSRGFLAVFYFLTYVLFTTYMLLNLFIGVITTEMAHAQEDMHRTLRDRARRAIAARLKDANFHNTAAGRSFIEATGHEEDGLAKPKGDKAKAGAATSPSSERSNGKDKPAKKSGGGIFAVAAQPGGTGASATFDMEDGKFDSPLFMGAKDVQSSFT